MVIPFTDGLTPCVIQSLKGLVNNFFYKVWRDFNKIFGIINATLIGCFGLSFTVSENTKG